MSRSFTFEDVEQQHLVWFGEALKGWVARSPDLRRALVDSLGSRGFGEIFDTWATAFEDVHDPDVPQARDAFGAALAEAGHIDISLTTFHDVVGAARSFCHAPEWFQDRKALRQAKKDTEKLRFQVQQLHKALGFVKGGDEGAHREDTTGPLGRQLRHVMTDLQGLLWEVLLGQRMREHLNPGATPSDVLIHALADLDRRLWLHLQGWERAYHLVNKRKPGEKLEVPANAMAQDLLHRLATIYEGAGGDLTATWANGAGHATSPFAKFLVLIYASLPRAARHSASENPSGFIAKAAEVLIDRKHGYGPMFPTLRERYGQ